MYEFKFLKNETKFREQKACTSIVFELRNYSKISHSQFDKSKTHYNTLTNCQNHKSCDKIYELHVIRLLDLVRNYINNQYKLQLQIVTNFKFLFISISLLYLHIWFYLHFYDFYTVAFRIFFFIQIYSQCHLWLLILSLHFIGIFFISSQFFSLLIQFTILFQLPHKIYQEVRITQ